MESTESSEDTKQALQRYRVLLEYDGSGFFGWQSQVDQRTVQGELERALEKLFGKSVRVQGSGRTDTGVHALGQAAHFDAPLRLNSDTIGKALNFHLPADVRITQVSEAPPEFHARFSARWRWYQYRIFLRVRAVERQYGWHAQHDLDGELLQQAAAKLSGDGDFTAFTATDPKLDHYRCRVYASQWLQAEDEWRFHIVANRFLRHMVRRLVGTMGDVARGRFTMDEFEQFLQSGRKVGALFTAPAHGLYLMRVGYGDFPYLEEDRGEKQIFPFDNT